MSLIDIGWGVAFIIAALVDFIIGEGFIWRRLLILALASLWAGRLVYHITQRYVPSKDDPRYAKVLESPFFRGPQSLRVLCLYLIQGLIATVIAVPFALTAYNDLPFFCPVEMLGLIVWMIGIVGESAADHQLTRFKMDPNNEVKVMDSGLWRYSRHPNYFFEWIIWIGFSLLALSSPYGYLALLSPAIMLYLLVKVSGIEITEKHSLETKGEAYADYQRKTSPFFPWFPF